MTAPSLSDASAFAPTVSVTVNGTPTSTDVTRSISSTTVIAEPNALDHATLIVANSYPELRFTHGHDAATFMEGSGLVVQAGYGGSAATLFDGEITSITASFPANGVPTLTVEAQNRLHRLTSPPRSHTYEQVTDSAVAETIASRNQLTSAASPTTVVHASVFQAHEDDLSFLNARARNNGYEVVVEGTTLYFRPRADELPPQLRLVWGDAQMASQPGSYPLQSFDPRLNARAPTTSVQVRGQDPTSAVLIIGTAQPGSEEVPAGHGETAAEVAQQAFGSNELVVVDRPARSHEEAETTARAIFNDRAQALVEATGTTIGIPDLRPGIVVELAGVGIRFSGTYYLVRVTHTIGASGYTTRFAARSGNVGAMP